MADEFYDDIEDTMDNLQDQAVSDVIDNMSLDELKEVRDSYTELEEWDNALDGLSIEELQELRQELIDSDDEDEQKVLKMR